MNSMELSKFDSDHYMSDYIYGKEDYLYGEFCEFLPDWVKADRIIRKHLKEVEQPPLVPSSSFDPFCHLSEPPQEAVVESVPIEIKKPKKLVEVIETGEYVEEKKPERLDGESSYPSLIVVSDNQGVKKEPAEEVIPSDSSIPVIKKNNVNVIDTMKKHISSTVRIMKLVL